MRDVSNDTISKNNIYNTIKTIFSIIFPIITFPYISRTLGAENIGKINYGLSIVNYFSLIASLGITTYAIRECSKNRNDKKSLSNTVSQILSINVITTCISYFLLFTILFLVQKLESYRCLIIIQSSMIIFATLGADWLNSAMEDFRYITLRTVFMQIISLVLMIIFVKEQGDYIKYTLITIVANSGANIINILYRRKYCTARFVLDIDWKKHLPPIITLFSMMIFQTVITNADTTMLGIIKGDVEVGLYSTSLKIYNLVNQVVAAIAWVVMPQLSSGFANKDYIEINRVLKYALNHTFVLGIPCIVGLNVLTRELILFFAGNEFIDASMSLHILTISLGLSFMGGFFGNMILLPSGREKLFLISCIASAVVNVILNALIIPFWGLNGAAFTTVVSQLVFLINILPNIEKDIKIDGIIEMLKGPIVGGTFIVAVCLIEKTIIKNNLILVCVAVFTSMIVYGSTLYALKNEYFMQTIKPIVKRLKRIGKRD